MPVGHYERKKRGFYKGMNPSSPDFLIKRALYFSNKQYWTLQKSAEDAGKSISEYIREVFDEHFAVNKIEYVMQNPKEDIDL